MDESCILTAPYVSQRSIHHFTDYECKAVRRNQPPVPDMYALLFVLFLIVIVHVYDTRIVVLVRTYLALTSTAAVRVCIPVPVCATRVKREHHCGALRAHRAKSRNRKMVSLSSP